MTLLDTICQIHDIQGVICDMDGLLVDSEPFWQQAEIEVFKPLGLSLTIENCHETTGLPTRTVVEYWQKKVGWQEVDIDEVDAQIVAKALKLLQQHAQPMQGVSKLLEVITSKGLPLGVASASPPEIIETVLQKIGISHYFNYVRSAQLEKRNKPFPDVYLTVANQLGVPIQQCLILEDSGNGVKGAVASGGVVVAVPAAHELNDPKFNKANYQLASLNELFSEVV